MSAKSGEAKVKPKPTRAEIEAQVDRNGKGATRELLRSWGVPWPPPKGWKKKLLRQSDAAAAGPGGKERRTAASGSKKMPPQEPCEKTGRDFYKSAAWKRCRFAILQKSDRQCMCCGWAPEHGGKNYLVVDHIKSVRLHPELALEPSNLQVLCNECNLGKGSFQRTDFRAPDEQEAGL